MVSKHYLSHLRLQPDDIPSFDRYPFFLPAVSGLDTLEFHPKVTFLIGDNGVGKSTLIEALAVSLGFNAEGGTRSFRFGARASHSELYRYIRVAKGIRGCGTVSSSGPRAFSMLPPRSKSSIPNRPWDRRQSILMEGCLRMSSLMESLSLH